MCFVRFQNVCVNCAQESHHSAERSLEQKIEKLQRRQLSNRGRLYGSSAKEGGHLLEDGGSRNALQDYYGDNDDDEDDGSSASGAPAPTLETFKIQHLRHLVVQYLACKDAVLRGHMETALSALLRFNEVERAAMEERRKADAGRESVYSIFGNLAVFT